MRPHFSLDEKHLRRAGLDYWHLVDLHLHKTLEEVLAAYPDNPRFLLTSHGHKSYTRVHYPDGSLLIFGREDKGLPADLLSRYPEDCVRIPMLPAARCLNLSSSAAIVLYEALRQNDFDLQEGTI